MSEIRVTFYGHACFGLECGGWRCVLDPYSPGSVPGLRPLALEADEVFCSHGHRDHAGTDCVRITGGTARPGTVAEYETWHDGVKGLLRGRNCVRVFTLDGLRIAHLGDLGCEPSPEILAALSWADCVLVPVGGHFTIGPDEAADLIGWIGPRVAVPMHFRSGNIGYGVIGEAEPFLRRFPDVQAPGSSFVLTEAEPRGIVLLTPAMAE